MPPGNPGAAQSVTIDASAVPAHLGEHGDLTCDCAVPAAALDYLAAALDALGEIGEIVRECQIEAFVSEWLVLGMYDNPGGAAPGEEAIRHDYLADGSVTEQTITPAAGFELGAPIGAIFDGPGALPQVVVVPATQTTLELNGYFSEQCSLSGDCASQAYNDEFGDPPGLVMAYGFTYVDNLGNVPLVDIGIASDDSIQATIRSVDEPLAEPVEVFILNMGRGSGGPGEVQDWIDDVQLPPGKSVIIIKVFEGGGGWNGRLGIFDAVTRAPLALTGDIAYGTAP